MLRKPTSFDVLNATLADLRKLWDEKNLGSVDLVRTYIQISEHNRQSETQCSDIRSTGGDSPEYRL